jgi:hypothetical protein
MAREKARVAPYVGFRAVIDKSTVEPIRRIRAKSRDRGKTPSIMSAELRPATAR